MAFDRRKFYVQDMCSFIKSTRHALLYSLFVLMGNASLSNAQLLVDFNASGKKSQAVNDWKQAGVTEDLSKAVIGWVGFVNEAGKVEQLSNLEIATDGFTGRYGKGRFGENRLLTDYFFARTKEAIGTVTIGPFADASGTPHIMKSSVAETAGHTFSIQPDTKFRLYLFATGEKTEENASFTFLGAEKVVPVSAEGGTIDNQFVNFDFKTGADIADLTLEFEVSGDRWFTAPVNGFAIVELP
jgi:hypothetical protein